MPIYKQTPDGPWWADVTPPGGKRIRKSLGTRDRREAETRYRELSRAAWSGGVIEKPKPEEVRTIEFVYGEALKHRWNDVKDIDGVKDRWNVLCRYIDPKQDVKDIDIHWAEDLLTTLTEAKWTHPKWKNAEPKPYTKATVNRFMALVGVLQRYAHTKGWHPSIIQMPKYGEGKGFKRRPLKDSEYAAMLEALKAPPRERWKGYADLLAVLWGTASRLGEITPLEWANVDWEDNALRWQDTKSGDPVSRPMSDTVRDILKARKDAGRGRPFDDFVTSSFRECWDWLCDTVGIEDRARVVPHSIRHRGVTQLLRAGHSDLKTARMAGHKSIATTQRYAHLVVEDLRDAAADLS